MSMKLRAYMRGLGVGIFVTALLLIIFNYNKNISPSNEEIKARAKELGMIENSLLKDLDSDRDGEQCDSIKDKSELTTPNNLEESMSNNSIGVVTDAQKDIAESQEDLESLMDKGSASEEIVNDTIETDKLDQNDIAESNSEDIDYESDVYSYDFKVVSEEEIIAEEKLMEESIEYVSLQISSTEGYKALGSRLENMGLINSATEFIDYMNQRGYNRLIKTGEVRIQKGASLGQIVRIVCKL